MYLTDGIFLYRVVGASGEQDDVVELEDCYSLNVARVPVRALRERRLRVVKPRVAARSSWLCRRPTPVRATLPQQACDPDQHASAPGGEQPDDSGSRAPSTERDQADHSGPSG